jgi:hypothetical protein
MLILIVVAAAVALAAFVAGYESQELAQRGYEDNKDLENLRVVSIVPNGTLGPNDNYTSMNVTIGSTDPNPTTILNISVNNNVVTKFYYGFQGGPLHRDGVGFPGNGNVNGSLTVPGDGVVTIYLSNVDPVNESFAMTGTAITANAPLAISLYTNYQNDFMFTYIPPVPIIKVDVVPGLGYNYTTIVDGLASFQPSGGNATLSSWTWNISGVTYDGAIVASKEYTDFFLPHPFGPDVQTDVPLCADPQSTPAACSDAPTYANYVSAYDITLVLTNSDGLVATTNVTYSP